MTNLRRQVGDFVTKSGCLVDEPGLQQVNPEQALPANSDVATTDLSETRDELVDTSLGHQPADLEDLRETRTWPQASQTMSQEEV
jgi:hypothetical protein